MWVRWWAAVGVTVCTHSEKINCLSPWLFTASILLQGISETSWLLQVSSHGTWGWPTKYPARRSTSRRTHSSHTNEVFRQKETWGSGNMSQEACPSGQGQSDSSDVISVTSINLCYHRVSSRHRGQGRHLLLPLLQSSEVFRRITTPSRCWRPLTWFYFAFKAKGGIYPSRGIVVPF